MLTDAPAADANFLTIDQAVANLDAAEIEREDEAPAQAERPATEDKPNTEAEPAAEDASEPETATDGETAEEEDSEAEAEEAEQPAIEPPRFWDAEAKKRFGELPRDLQELVLAKETERDKATAKALQETAEKRKAADGEASKIAQLNGVLDKLLPQAVETFKSRWENVDWNAVVDQYGAEQALKLRNDFERERGTLMQLQAAKGHAEQVRHQKFIEAEMEKLPVEAPDLADPQLGLQRRTDLANFLTSEMTKRGLDTSAISRLSAFDTSLAYDAMRWRQAQAEAKAKSSAPKTQAPKTPAAPARPSVKATAAPARAASPQSARLQQLSRKQHLTVDEAVELLDLQEN